LKNTARGLKGRDLLAISDLAGDELLQIVGLAARIKSGDWSHQPLHGKYVAMLFQRPSHRTRVSFEVGIAKLGGHCITLGEEDVQIGRRESVADAARVLDRYVDVVVARLRRHQELVEFAAAASRPVINALTEQAHPCQVLADLLTIAEVCGSVQSARIAYVGDGNNIARSLMEAAELLGFSLTVIAPPAYLPAPNGAKNVTLTPDVAGLDGAKIVYTDVWTSMGQEAERERRRHEFAPYQVNDALLARAPEALFMHCLPAHRGEEVTDTVIDGPRSIVLQQAENRLYAQMALLALVVQ
jgi:ornithine carbamoyltransferase